MLFKWEFDEIKISYFGLMYILFQEIFKISSHKTIVEFFHENVSKIIYHTLNMENIFKFLQWASWDSN